MLGASVLYPSYGLLLREFCLKPGNLICCPFAGIPPSGVTFFPDLFCCLTQPLFMTIHFRTSE